MTYATVSPTNRCRDTNNPRRPPRGVDGRSVEGRRRRDLIDAYIRALGGRGAISEATMGRVVRCAELAAVAESLRRRYLAGEAIDIEALIRFENLHHRAERELAIKNSVPPGPSLREYLAAREAGSQTGNPGAADTIIRETDEGGH